MLTIETERRVTQFLITLSEEELKVQREKEELINDYDFNPYECFKFMDKNSKESIDYYDIFNFMKDNLEYITLHESFLIILYYDTKDQNFWSYENFVNYLLNGYSSLSQIRRFEFINSKEGMKDSVKKLLLDIFKSELELIHNTVPLVKKIKDRYDYNIADLFRSITNNCDIDKNNINDFMIRNGYDNFPEIKLNAIINRLSLSKNSLVTLCDLQRLFEVGYCDNIKNDLYESMFNCPKNKINEGYVKNESKYKINIEENNENNLSNNETTNTFSSNNFILNFDYNSEKNIDEDFNFINKFDYDRLNKKKDINYQNDDKQNFNHFNEMFIPEREIKENEKQEKDNNEFDINVFNEGNELENTISLTKQKYKVLNQMNKKNNNINNDINNNNDNSIFEIFEEKYFVDYLEYILRNEILIEKKKGELALRADFNIEDCIKIFKPNTQLNENFISQEDFIYGTHSLELTFNKEEIKLFFCKYDLMNNGYLTFSDFFDMLVPFNSKYREMVENRESLPYRPKYKINEIFLDSTKNYLKDLFQCICISEISIEKERHKLMRYLNSMSLDKIFYKMDKDKKGFLVQNDLFNYLKNWNVTILESESDLVFIRIDRDRNGIITLNDIITETSLVLSDNNQNI